MAKSKREPKSELELVRVMDVPRQRRDAERVEFLASFPPTQAAVKFDGEGGARMTLDVPDECVDAIVTMLAWRGELLRVTVEPA